MIDLEGIHDEEFDVSTKIIKAPFAYMGGKSKSVKYILPHLPDSEVYVEPFGGSGVVLLNKRKSKLEVFNDRYSGVVDFYRCLQDYDKMNKMIQYLETQIHSREMFEHNKREWVTEIDPAIRAAKWYAMARHSFNGKMNNWGRCLNASTSCMSDKIQKNLPVLHNMHIRLKTVQYENRDALTLLHEYDSPDTVFYLDPPYVDAYNGGYKYEMTHEEHRRLIDLIFDLKGFVAVSGYDNQLYDSKPWDDKITWNVLSTAAGNNNEGGQQCATQIANNNMVQECLWIKE